MNLLPCGCHARCFIICECGIYILLAHSSKVTLTELEPDNQLGKECREHGREPEAEHHPGVGAANGFCSTVFSDACRQDRCSAGEQPQAHPELLPKLDRAGQQPGPRHSGSYPEPPGAGTAPKGGLRDLDSRGDQRV